LCGFSEEYRKALNLIGTKSGRDGDKIKEAGAILVGGHSIDDQEPKYGLSVTGIVHPNKFWRNVGAKAGEVLVLTKPIGVGILTTGIKQGAVTPEQEKIVTETMAMLNKKAAEVLSRFSPSAVTDVTGFGLLGHGSEMASGSNVTLVIEYDKVPILDGALKLAQDGIVPGGSKANHKWLEKDVEYYNIAPEEQIILCDAITSGGLLIAINPSDAEKYVKSMKDEGHDSWIIGEVTDKQDKLIIVNK